MGKTTLALPSRPVLYACYKHSHATHVKRQPVPVSRHVFILARNQAPSDPPFPEEPPHASKQARFLSIALGTESSPWKPRRAGTPGGAVYSALKRLGGISEHVGSRFFARFPDRQSAPHFRIYAIFQFQMPRARYNKI